MDATKTADEIASEIKGKKASALRSIRFHGGSANSREIRRTGEIPSGSMYHHLSGLREMELIEQNGREHVGKGGQAKVWVLTATGEAVAERVADDQPSIDEVDEFMDSVDERINSLEETHSENFDEVEREIEELREEFSTVRGLLEDVQEYFEDETED